MVAAVQARSLIITVNGRDWSENLVSLEIGWDSYEQGKGLILKRGTLTLCNIKGDVKLIDPIDQDDFVPGNIVTVSITGVGAHPLAGKLRILTPPEVSAINQGIPEIEGNLVVAIPVGCELAYRKTQEPDRDATGVTLGTQKLVTAVINDLLNTASVSDIGSIPGIGYWIDYPYSKNGGGFVNLAGEFAYVVGAYPSVLYCGSDGFVNSLSVNVELNPTSGIEYLASTSDSATVTLGDDDREYARQLDLSLAPGEVEINGIARYTEDITEDYPFTDTVIEQETIFTNEEVEQPGGGVEFVTTSTTVSLETSKTYYYSEDRLPGLNPAIFSFQPHSGFVSIANSDYKGYSGTVTTVRQNGKQISVEYQFSLYDYTDRLFFEIQSQYVLAREMYPSDWEDQAAALDAGDIWDITKAIRIRNKADDLFPSQITVSEFSFNSSAVVQRVSRVFSNYYLVDRSASLDEQFDWAFNYSFNMVTKEIKTETWTQKNGRWAYSTETRSPVIVVNPGFQSNSEIASIIRSQKLSMTSKATAPSSSTVLARDTQPSSITYWEGKFRLKEIQLTGRALFGNGENTKRYQLQSPFWMTTGQPDRFAQAEGLLINGRQYQYLVEAEPSLFTTLTAPLPNVTVIEPTANRYFLADSLTWFHTATEAYVAFAGILVGSSDTGGTSVTTLTTTMQTAKTGDGPLVDENGDVVLDANGNVVYSGTITISGYAIGSTVRGTAYDI
jgi:hypothetical protein